MLPKTSFLQLGEKLPQIGAPFAVLLNADDFGWFDNESRPRWINTLLKNGCRYFVCFGERSEELHDEIDELIVTGEYRNVITTFHNDESPREVFEFFKNVASTEMREALVFVHNVERWKRRFKRSVD